MLIKRTLCFVDELTSDAGEIIEPALRKVAVVGVIDNAFAGRFERDLSPLVRKLAGKSASWPSRCSHRTSLKSTARPPLSASTANRSTNAMLTTVFGNVMREGDGGGKAWIASITKRAVPAASIDIPLAHKEALYVRSHYDGITITLPDAPLPNEIAVICAFANRAGPMRVSAGWPRKTSKARTG
jgi:hypothetical protein